MSEEAKKRGRPKSTGDVVYLGRLRLNESAPAALRDLLERFKSAPAGRKQHILMAALIGGLGQATQIAQAEDHETEELLNNFLEEM
jgi:hypothetical protein